MLKTSRLTHLGWVNIWHIHKKTTLTKIQCQRDQKKSDRHTETKRGNKKTMKEWQTAAIIPWCMNPLSHSSTPKISASSLLRQSPFIRERAGADLVNWGPQAKIGMGPYTFADIHLNQPWVSFFCHDACCCTMVPHNWVQCFYIFHAHIIKVVLSFSFKFIHLADTFILSSVKT